MFYKVKDIFHLISIMFFLQVDNLGKQYKNKWVLHPISFQQMPAQKIAVAGATGSGKTTLLQLIAGLLQPTTGSVFFKGYKIDSPDEQLIPGQKNIAYLSQHFELRNNYWVHEVLSYNNHLSNNQSYELYRICKIDHLLNRRTNELSGGERQRIALAKLLVYKPELLILDEPFSNLDNIHKRIMQSVINDVQKNMQVACLLSSHDTTDLLSWADEILVLQNGKLIQQGTSKDIYYKPINEYCAGLFGAYNILDESVFAALDSIEKNNQSQKRILVRPEAISIKAANHVYNSNNITDIHFHGSYCMIDVIAETKLIQVKVLNNSFKIGDKVALSISPESIWYI